MKWSTWFFTPTDMFVGGRRIPAGSNFRFRDGANFRFYHWVESNGDNHLTRE